jgi:hypothetical protein
MNSSETDTGKDDPSRVPRGWTAITWAQELRRKADRCQDTHPDRARRYRETAAALLRQAEELKA